MSSLSKQILIDNHGNVDVVQVQVPPPPPQTLRDIKRLGRIATFKPDQMLARWNYAPRSADPAWKGLPCPPQTIVMNEIRRPGKGSVIPLTQQMLSHLVYLNTQRLADKILIPAAGWKNTTNDVVQRLSWSCNHVIVMEERAGIGGMYSRIYAPDCNSTLSGTFFDPDYRLIIHKFNAICEDGHMIKLGAGFDVYTPLVDDGGLWINSEELFFWQSLPFVDDEGGTVIEYSLLGYQIFGVRADGSQILLRDAAGFKTGWTLPIPEVPI